MKPDPEHVHLCDMVEQEAKECVRFEGRLLIALAVAALVVFLWGCLT